MAVLETLHPSSRAAARGWSDLTIRNMFILPTIAFLVIFNIFPLLYSLAYSRGRFVVEGGGAARLVLPAWPEAARAIEDCRN